MDTFIGFIIAFVLVFSGFMTGSLWMKNVYLRVTDMSSIELSKIKRDCEENLTRLENCKIIYVKSESGE